MGTSILQVGQRARRRFRAGLAVAGILVLAAACAPRIDTRGNLPDPELLADLRPGEISRVEVEELLGSPSTVAMFENETWFYVSERTETVAFMAPEVTERKIIMLTFDDRGLLTEKEEIGLDAGKDVDPVDRETPTAGNRLTIIDQLIGNLGRFNKGKK